MTAFRSDRVLPSQDLPVAVESDDWVAALMAYGPGRDAALRSLHELLLRAARYQVSRMRGQLWWVGAERIDELVNQAADEAMVAVLAKLPTFEGRSRFTTWAYKFAILQVAVEVRRFAWRDRDIELHDQLEETRDAGPEQYAEASDLSRAMSRAIEHALTAHQRRILLALIVDEVPIDVLAERLGSTRNALYKTLHDARTRLREHLAGSGHLPSAKDAVMHP